MTIDKTKQWWMTAEKIAWVQLLLDSHRRWTGRDLIERRGSEAEDARTVYEAPFVVVSHGNEPDPILNYGNRIALDLWAMEWREFSRTPSRQTAEPEARAERERMLAAAATHGYFTDYRGVRISKTGRRFLVEDATVWNLIGGDGRKLGQAATFSKWTFQ